MSEAKPPETAENRRIETAWKSRAAIEGAGVHLKRAFDNGDGLDLDPFPLLDDFRGDSPELYLPRFPSHPHRGMETITYVLDGQVEHTDSLGNGGVIGAGDVQWMTAGSGIIHQEMPKGDSRGRMDGFQLWANLPGAHKMSDPGYREVPETTIPVVRQASGAEVRVIAGNVEGTLALCETSSPTPNTSTSRLPPVLSFTTKFKTVTRCLLTLLRAKATSNPNAAAPASLTLSATTAHWSPMLVMANESRLQPRPSPFAFCSYPANRLASPSPGRGPLS